MPVLDSSSDDDVVPLAHESTNSSSDDCASCSEKPSDRSVVATW